MKQKDSASHRTQNGLALVVLGAVIGCSAMYVLDPKYGKRRRTHLRDKAIRLSHVLARWADRSSRHLRNKARGLIYKTTRTIEPILPQPIFSQRKSLKDPEDRIDASW